MMDEDIARVRTIDNPVARCVVGLLDFFIIYHQGSNWGLSLGTAARPLTIA